MLVGTGMGLNFSGDLSDAAFYQMSESWFIHDMAVKTQAAILMYVRFKDDVFMILRDGHFRAFCDFMEKWRSKAGSFKLTVEAISRSRLTVLDLDLEITQHMAQDGKKYRVGFKPHFKPTSLGVPLSSSSSHPWHVHVSWPFAQIQRFHSLSDSHVSFTNAKHVFVRRLHDNFEPSPLIKALCDFIPPNRLVGRREHVSEQGRHTLHSRVLWMVLPYHFVWEAACLAKVANKFLHSPEAQILWAKAWGKTPECRIGLAWKVTSPPLATLFKSLWRLDGEVAA